MAASSATGGREVKHLWEEPARLKKLVFDHRLSWAILGDIVSKVFRPAPRGAPRIRTWSMWHQSACSCLRLRESSAASCDVVAAGTRRRCVDGLQIGQCYLI